MAEIKVVDVSTLPKETKDFKGISLPFYKGKAYGVMDLDAYQAHIISIVGGKNKEDAGLVLKFKGFTDNPNVNTTTIITNPNVDVYFSNPKRMFVFKVGNTFYLQHETLSATYNDTTKNTVRQDKTFLNNTTLYSYNELEGGIMAISIIPVQTTGDSEKDVMSQKAVSGIVFYLRDIKADKTTKVNGKPLSSDITLTKADVGLDKVDNTADLDKPISTSQKVVNDDFDTRLRWAALNNPPSWFKDSLVCMYDVKRQGATNENLKANPVLKDFSPNGLDMKLHGFNWKGMSGMGGYSVDFKSDFVIYESRIVGEIQYNNIHITKVNMSNWILLTHKAVNGTKIKVSGLKKGEYIRYIYVVGDNVDATLFLNENKTYELPSGIASANKETGFYLNIPIGACDITIEQLPIYEDALVFDGVDDYGINENQPILTDYTVIAKRVILEDVVDKFTSVASKPKGSFAFEYMAKDARYAASFGTLNLLHIKFKDDCITFQTKANYNGKSIKYGDKEDVKKLLIGKYEEGFQTLNMALYQFLLFDRTLTQEEIDWVKKNVMQSEHKYEGSNLTPLYESAGAVFNHDTGYYELNGLTDITEEQMRDIYNETNNFRTAPNLSIGYQFDHSEIRTNICKHARSFFEDNSPMNARYFANIGNFEVFKLYHDATLKTEYKYPTFYAFKVDVSSPQIFAGNNKLREIIGALTIIGEGKIFNPFQKDTNLIEVRLVNLQCSIEIKDSALLSKDSLYCMIFNKHSEKAITITLHPDVYNKVKNSNATWGDIYDLAQTKNISLASA